jgi:hypothetical protein
MAALPNHTLYVQNLDEKLKKDGEVLSSFLAAYFCQNLL